MKIKRLILTWLLTLLTLAGGLVNLFFLISPSIPGRRELLTEIFPLEFLHLSRQITLLIGFILVISSINIYRRKKRAFQFVLALSGISVILHLIKGLDYEQAIYSLVLMIILLISRKLFTVKSSIPNMKSGLIRFAIAILLVFTYGVLGFWFLDERQFGINFSLGNSVVQTLRMVTLVGDPQLVPHTHHAKWFLNSLYLITIVSVLYSLFAIFRPVIYGFATLPHQRELARSIAEKNGRSSLDFFKYWHDKSIFFSHSQNSFLAYRVGMNYALVLGDPVGPEDEIEEIIGKFIDMCDQNDWGYGFYQASPDFIDIYAKYGLKKLKIGEDAIVDLTQLNLDGKEMKKIRHAINKLESSGIRFVQYDPPIHDKVLFQIKQVSDEWLKIPGRRERGFTLGNFEAGYIKSTPIIAAVDSKNVIQAFVNLIPSYAKGEATIDLMRHRLNSPNGIMDYLFIKLFLHIKEKGFQRFNLGMAPMSGFQENEEASIEEKAVHFFFQRLNFLFSYSGLRQYKAKFASSWEPRYIIYRNVLDLPRIAIALDRVGEIRTRKRSIFF
jgi:phosphatidylglycerol lysyltransferase